jgi:uncharacterized membrane protein YidH (DUF202 family)
MEDKNDLREQLVADTLKKENKKKKKEEQNLIRNERLRIAIERLQIAWLRMAITLMAFGFTIYKVLESVIEEGKRKPLFGYFDGRDIGLLMLIIGFLGLAQATWQHVKNISMLRKIYADAPASISLRQTYIILLFILFLLMAILFRL